MFSVVMPAWNTRTTIVRTVASVLAQDWTGFELIIVDDGSTDGTIDELSGIRDERIRIIRTANEGPGPARNRGIEAARFEWVAFVDADDIWMPDHLTELDHVRTRHPQADLIGTSYMIHDFRHGVPAASRDPGRIGVVNYFEGVGSGLQLLYTSTAAIPRRTYDTRAGFLDVVPGQQ